MSNLRVTNLRGRTAGSSPTLPDGAVVTGIVTATSFSGAVTGNISGGTVAGSTGSFTGDVDIADKIIHTGDTNTAIRFPAADTFTVETAGSEAIRVDSSGRLFIGTTSEINSSTASNFQIANASGPRLCIARNDTTTASGNLIGGLDFYGNDSDGTYENCARILAEADADHTTDSKLTRLTFYTAGSDPDVPEERLRITSAGRVLIGATSGAGLFSVHESTSSTSNYINITNNTTGSSSWSNGMLLGNNASGDALCWQNENLSLIFGTNNAERARIDSSGRLLVGTTTATTVQGVTAALQLQTSTYTDILTKSFGSYTGIRLSRANNTSASPTAVASGNNLGAIFFHGYDGTDYDCFAGYVQCEVDGTPGSNDMPGRLMFGTASDGAATATERMRITKDGHVQIAANSSNEARIQFAGSGARMQYGSSSGHIDFYTNSAVRNRFLYNGQGTEFSNQSKVIPTTDNAVDLGSSGNRWDDVFATNGTIQTSDSRLKREVETSVLGINFVKALRPVSYKWIEGKKVPIVDGTDENGENIYRTDGDGNWVYESRDGARKHWGFIAQEVKQVVDDVSVDFAGWTLADKDDPESTQSLRYEEFIAPLTKALQEAITKIETLETEVAALKAG